MQMFERISGEGFPKWSHPAENDLLLESTIVFKTSFEDHSFGCLSIIHAHLKVWLVHAVHCSLGSLFVVSAEGHNAWTFMRSKRIALVIIRKKGEAFGG